MRGAKALMQKVATEAKKIHQLSTQPVAVISQNDEKDPLRVRLSRGAPLTSPLGRTQKLAEKPGLPPSRLALAGRLQGLTPASRAQS